MFNIEDFDVKKFDDILSRGLSKGLGDRKGQMCIEAAICATLDLPHSDDPQCVSNSILKFKIKLNDSDWSSPYVRAKELRDLGLAQLGSLDIVDDLEFIKRLSKKIIQVLIPKLLREIFKNNLDCLEAAELCELKGTSAMAYSALANISNIDTTNSDDATAYVTAATYDAIYTAADFDALYAAATSDDATYETNIIAAIIATIIDATHATHVAHPNSDEYLILAAKLALEVLEELGSPGVKLI